MNKELWRSYVRQCRAMALLLAGCAAIFAAVFALYGLPWGAVAYPTALCALLGLGWTAWRFAHVRRRCRELERLDVSQPDALPPPEGPLEAAYQSVLRAAVREQTETRRAIEHHYTGMLEYYTLWAHQIKTPIASMRLNLQNEHGPLSRQLSEDVTRVEQYVEMALMFLKLDESGTDYVLRECDLDRLIRQAIRRLSSQFIRKRLRLCYQPLNARAVTDEKWLGFVIEQILTNALKYTDSGEISITLEAPKTLCVRDTGIGIAPEDLPRVFEKGFTGLNGRQYQRASGIGLYLCRRVCERLGHRISVESELGKGSVFRVCLDQRRVSE